MSIKIKQNNYIQFGLRIEKDLSEKIDFILLVLGKKFNAKISKNELINELINCGIDNAILNIDNINYSAKEIIQIGESCPDD